MHDAFNDRLSEYLDDELSTDERAAVEDHLRACSQCRADLEGLRAVVARAGRLQDSAPQADLWPGVAARIGAVAPARDSVTTRRFSFTLPQLVAAGLALMLLSGSMVWLARLGGPRTDFPPVGAVEPVPVNFADGAYDEAIEDLQRTFDAGRTRLDRETVRILEDNLQAIDQAITQCREALADDPTNIYLNAYLSSARARKLDLLRRATAIVDRAS